MQFKKDATVFTADDREVGEIDRVIIDPKTREVTHVAVRKGLFFKEDKLVPIDLVASATEEGVELREDAGELEALPDLEELHLVPLNKAEIERDKVIPGYVPPFYWYPPSGAPTGYPVTAFTSPFVIETERNVPEGAILLKEGAKVISLEGEHVGDVERILTEPQADRVTHFVISEGLLLKEKKLIPVAWVDEVTENKVHVAVGSEFIAGLREYEE